MCDLGVIGVGAEIILLAVAGAEDIVAGELNRNNGANTGPAKLNWVNGEVAGLDAVGEWQPGKIAESKHETKAVCRDVDGRKNSWLVVESVKYVRRLSDSNKHCKKR